MNRDDWLAWRREGIGASDVAGILGISRWSSPWKVWADKVGLLPDDDMTDLMEFGHRAEPMIADWFADRTGLRVANPQQQLDATGKGYPWARCTLDGEVFDGYTLAGNIEIKTAGPGKTWEQVPADYVAQCRWQQFVGGYDNTWVAVLMGRRLDIHEVPRDDTEIAWMLERVERFWSDHVITGVAPEVDGSEATTAALAAVYGDPVEASAVDLPPHTAVLISEYRAAKAQATEAAERAQALGNDLRSLLGEHEIGLVGGAKAVSWKSQPGRSGIDLEGLRAAHPSIAEKFITRGAPIRVLRTHNYEESSS